jgi:hypothetical protein
MPIILLPDQRQFSDTSMGLVRASLESRPQTSDGNPLVAYYLVDMKTLAQITGEPVAMPLMTPVSLAPSSLNMSNTSSQPAPPTGPTSPLPVPTPLPAQPQSTEGSSISGSYRGPMMAEPVPTILGLPIDQQDSQRFSECYDFDDVPEDLEEQTRKVHKKLCQIKDSLTYKSMPHRSKTCQTTA